MAGDVRLTEERLRTWLDGNQPARERLCVQLLSMDRRFRGVRPRQPKGGPDGGYDLEAATENGSRVVGAIGFRNSPTDGAADQRWAKVKFESDFVNAVANAGEFTVFVFFTNIRLSVGARQKLRVLGRTLSEAAVEIVDREQMRLALDSAEGLAARYQFLQISLSEAEQASFFARWGADLESLVATSFAAVEERLHRLEFLHDRQRRLAGLSFRIRLRSPTTAAELGHVRAVLSLGKFTRDLIRSQWHVGVCNNSPLRRAPNRSPDACLATAFWLAEPNSIRGTSARTWADPFAVIYGSGGFDEFSDPAEAASLGDLDEAMFAFVMNRRLFEVSAAIDMYANEYLIWSASVDDLAADRPNEDPRTPWSFSEDELADEWVRVGPKSFVGSLHFSTSTPRRMWNAPRLAVPRQ